MHPRLRPLNPIDDAVRLYDAWLDEITERLADPSCGRDELCAEILQGLFFPGLPSSVDPDGLSPSARIALANLDPRNVTLEPEYYHGIDAELYYHRKPLIWLWQMFDRSPLGGNVHLGVRFRRLLASYVFQRVGENFKGFHFAKVSFGYNLVGRSVSSTLRHLSREFSE